jgi:8-oxo-dGTP diphosphatase
MANNTGISLFLKKKTEKHDSVLVILTHQDKYVLVRNKNRAWEFPGGHKENKESYLETAKREAFEEAGVTLKNIDYLGYYILPSNHITIIMHSEVEQFYDLPKDFETVEVEIFDTLPNNLSFQDGLYEEIIKKISQGGLE